METDGVIPPQGTVHSSLSLAQCGAPAPSAAGIRGVSELRSRRVRHGFQLAGSSVQPENVRILLRVLTCALPASEWRATCSVGFPIPLFPACSQSALWIYSERSPCVLASWAELSSRWISPSGTVGLRSLSPTGRSPEPRQKPPPTLETRIWHCATSYVLKGIPSLSWALYICISTTESPSWYLR